MAEIGIPARVTLRTLPANKLHFGRSRRLWILAVAAVYCFAVTDAAFVALDWLSPVGAVVAARGAGLQCEYHACGCASEEACRKRCCCFNEAGAPRQHESEGAEIGHRHRSARSLVSAVLSERCAGHSRQGTLFGLAKVPPHALSARSVDLFRVALAPPRLLEDLAPASHTLDPPRKVPIA